MERRRSRPEPLDALPVPKRNIFSVNFRFDKQGLAEKAGWKERDPEPKQEVVVNSGDADAGELIARNQSARNMAQIMLALHTYHDMNNQFPAPRRYTARTANLC